MANYQSLKAAINAVIKANGNKEITGTVLNEVLLAMVNSLGAGYQFAGVATPSTNPGTPDQKVFYIASQAGTYTNFGGAVVSDGIAIFKWNGTWTTETLDLPIPEQVQSDWTEDDTTKKSYIKHKPNIPPSANVDPVPTEDSPNAVSSGGVYDVTHGTLKTRYIPFDLRGESIILLSDEDMTELFGPATMVGGQSLFDLTVGQYQHVYRVTNSKSEVFEIQAAYSNVNGARKIVGINGNLTIGLSFTITNGVYINAAIAKRETSIPGISYEEEQDLTAKQQVQAQNNMMAKAYAPSQFNGLGKKVLSKNIQTVSGVEKNVLTQAMMPVADGGHTLYELQYDYDLNGAEIRVPDGSVIDFNGGTIKNGTLKSNNFTIKGHPTTNIFGDCIVKGLDSGFYDVRWFGAIADYDETNHTGTDNTEAFRRAIVACGNNTGSYVKVVGKYLIGQTIEVENDLNIKGEYLPDRTFFSSDVVTENTASLIYVPENVTAFLVKGRGTSTRRSCNINIQNIKLVGGGSSNGSVFLESTMTGAPARVGTFSEVECKGFNKVLYFHDTGLFSDGTLYGNFTIEKVVAYYNNQFIVARTSANNIPSMCNLVIRDSNIEQNGSYVIDLEKIFGSVIIDNNILEDQANPIKVYIINGSVEITNNYFESNTGEYLFDINSQNVFNSYVTIRNNYVLNNVLSKISVRNCTILQMVQRNLDRNTHDFSSSIFANDIPKSTLTKDFNKVLQLSRMKDAANVDGAHPIMFSDTDVMPNGLYGSFITGTEPFKRIAYIQGVDIHQGDTMVFVLYCSSSIQFCLYDLNGAKIIENVDTLYLSGYCLLKYIAIKDTTSINIYASSAYGNDFYICNGFLYVNPDDNKPINEYFIANLNTVFSINYADSTAYKNVPVFAKGKNQSNMFFGDGENIRSVIAGIKERAMVVTKYVQYGTFTDANTTYFVAGDIDLNGNQVIVPAGCTLDFSLGGKIISSQAGGTLTLTGTKIAPNGCKISDYITASMTGTFAVGQCLFDETLGKPKWYNGTDWVDGSGNVIS